MRLSIPFGLLLAATSAYAGDNVMLVLDASGSMWGQIDGKSKVEIARETVANVLRDWNPEDQLGLIAYGHRRKGDCNDIETLIPVSPLDEASYLRTVNGLNALGMTPLSAAVQQAATALRSSEQKATVILVSDGEETCKLDPCKVGEELEKSGVDFTAHVIGFDVKDVEHQAQLRCLAQATGGRYYNAGDARELGAALRGAVEANSEPPPPPATASLTFEGPGKIAHPIAVKWDGPGDIGDYIAIALPDQAGNRYLTYATIYEPEIKSGVATLLAPATAGQYELRYVSTRRDNAVLAREALEVVEQEASLEVATKVAAGSLVKIVARGPYGERDWVGFAKVGSNANSYLQWTRLSGPESSVEVRAPAEPGTYELRYVLNESERILVQQTIEVVEVEATVSGADRVMAGDIYPFEASGPVDERHWIGFAPAGSGAASYRDFARPTGQQSAGVLSAPTQPGAYELRYVLNESERVIASKPVTVDAPIASLEFPATITAGDKLTIQFSGPRGKGTAIGFVHRNTKKWGDYEGNLAHANGTVVVSAPAEPGEYDIAYEFDNGILLRKPVTVR
jgi:Ca-activated chloride channel family protein